MVKLNSKGIMYWLAPSRNWFTGEPLQYAYSVINCQPGFATLTRNDYSITVRVSSLWNHIKGMLVQDAFPDLSATDREFLITGLNPQQQTKLYNSLGDKEQCTP